MKKIGILTHYYGSKNIGGLLQAYALVQALNQCGREAQQISFNFDLLDGPSKQRLRQLRLANLSMRKILRKPFRLLNNVWEKYQRAKIKGCLTVQNKLFAEFEQFIPNSLEQYTNTNIAHSKGKYDVFITGSDQVFSSNLLHLTAFFGEFLDKNKKIISYAASSDKNQFSVLAEKLFVQKLQRLNAVGVREKTLKEYIERIMDKKATVVLDPTLLLSPTDWLKIANPADVSQKPYVFCYFLGGKSVWQRKMAQAYADKYGYEVIHLPYIRRSIRSADRFLKGEGRYNVGPREFISLINGAQCVFTDSFHGLAFCINFGKNFYVFNRDDQSGPQSMNARITDTLATFGLTARHITERSAILDNKPLDFTQVHRILVHEKEKSINWLLDALRD